MEQHNNFNIRSDTCSESLNEIEFHIIINESNEIYLKRTKHKIEDERRMTLKQREKQQLFTDYDTHTKN